MTAKTTMSRARVQAGITGLCLLAGPFAHAQVDFSDPTLRPNHVRVGGRFAFDVSADLRHVGSSPAIPPHYDDGYVLPDVNGGGVTWNWGYLNEAQYQPPFVDQHVTDSALFTGRGEDMDPLEPQPGFEILYARDLLRVPLAERRVMLVGVEGGFTTLNADFETRERAAGPVSYRTDRYDAGGIAVPHAPYWGSYNRPGPTLPLNPAQTLTDTPNATSDLTSQLDTLVLGFKVGGFVELPLWRQLSFRLSVGAAIMDVLTELRYTEQIHRAGSSTLLATHSAKENDSEWLFGFYGQAALGLRFNEYLSGYVGAQFQGLSDTSIRAGAEEATLNLDSSVELVLGLSLSF